MKKILFVCSLLLTVNFYGQKKVEISLQQDARLLILGDDKGNDPLTVNLMSKLEVPIHNFKKSHISTYLSVEYADLAGKNYKRYALGIGYVLDSVYKKIGAGAYVDFGKIYRKAEGFNSYSLSGELSFKLNNCLRFICTQQLTHRKDLKILYNSKKEFIISGFVGIKYSI
ncbi:MAG: hypothetical protein ABJH82_13260 [Polaribacter sp.]|uniref:hypothetical protein n=1 Tax=Polaribacter sp. TaxID=1920175 RepID=UPI003266DCC8